MKSAKIITAALAALTAALLLPSAGLDAGNRVTERAREGMTGPRRQLKKAPKDFEVRKISIKVGARKSFSVLFMADNHLVRCDTRDSRQKGHLAQCRNDEFPWGPLYFEYVMRYAREHNLPILHGGDMIDFVSEMNLDYAAKIFSEGNFLLVTPGNHEFSRLMGYFGPEKEDEDYKMLSYDKVQEAYPYDFRLSSKIVNGVNIVAIDDNYMRVTSEQWELVRREFERGYPVVLMTHVPFYVDSERSAKGHSSCGTPGKSDETTLGFLEWLKAQPQLKAVLAAHNHGGFFIEQFSPTAKQYVTAATCDGGAYQIKFL